MLSGFHTDFILNSSLLFELIQSQVFIPLVSARVELSFVLGTVMQTSTGILVLVMSTDLKMGKGISSKKN